jgi:DNA-binding response OmpR family regulator
MKILLVEDNQKLAGNIKQGLIQENFSVEVIEDGLDAENNILMNRNNYDLIILDLMLPGKSGLAVCGDIRKKGIKIPILILTALDQVEDKVLGLNSGADDYLQKPFAFEELLARINALLRRPKELQNDILVCGDIQLDKLGKVAKFKNKIISLTLKEFMLLEYLISNANNVITRDTLYSHVWDDADTTFSNTVDVHIKNLRKKIHDDGKIIQTVRGVGYKVEN